MNILLNFIEPPHSCGMGCPHCGEEFGIESQIEDAKNEAAKAEALHIIEQLETLRKLAIVDDSGQLFQVVFAKKVLEYIQSARKELEAPK